LQAGSPSGGRGLRGAAQFERAHKCKMLMPAERL
jgi:hypothetical protein